MRLKKGYRRNNIIKAGKRNRGDHAMTRPEIVVNVFSSADGKITTAPGRNVSEWTAAGVDGEAHDAAHRLYDDLGCDGLISGSETLMVYGSHWVDLEKAVYEPQKSKAYIVFDGKGRINWHQTEGLIVVTKENVSEDYIRQLEEKNISYIQAGSGDFIDLPAALEKLYEKGFRRLGISGGGGVNGAFLRAGLIDEISLVLAPVAVGGNTTPSIFDCSDLKDLEGVTELELLASRPVGRGSVWVHYKVKKAVPQP
ncbi:RibD family protein [Alteribacter natronophilus]|uniref:RibD family protein n=1 Tax=Alteribacter natronophilus TaxID=2583810 RepID=UPI00110D9E4E|nr:RibD family protein [Alteribacter natronophilus]TMW71003.1 RibD family protein [Alteribacter natronophilus]